MTENKLAEEATKYALEWGDKTDGTYACCRDGYLAGAEPREKRIVELEKENTELKSIAEFQTSSNMDRYFQLKRRKERLTKAKEIIKRLMHELVISNRPYDEVELLVKDVEQFLKEVSE